MDPGTFMDLSTGYWKSAALNAAVELGVFGSLSRKPGSAAAIAADTGSNEEYLEALLNALAGMGLLYKHEEVFRIAEAAEPLLDSHSEGSLLDALRLNADLYPLWGKLAECVRAGAPVIPQDHLGPDPERTRRFVKGMHSRAGLLAPALAEAVDCEGCRHLLDIACGPGTLSAALLGRYADLRVTLLDLSPVLDVAREIWSGREVADRMTFHPGHFLDDVFPGGMDAVLFSGAMHQLSPGDAQRVLEKAREALVPGGRLFLVDLMLDTDGATPAFSSLFSLNMMLTSPSGRVYSREDAAELVNSAGFAGGRTQDLSPSPYSLLIAERP